MIIVGEKKSVVFSCFVGVCVCDTWYILKGMYLKPPSSVGYSISFLFMAQNWSNLSVTTQTCTGYVYSAVFGE